jgi:hypothetical protein
MDDYEVNYASNCIRFQPFKINIRGCRITDLTFNTIPNVTYNVYTPEHYAYSREFTQVIQAGSGWSVN